MYYEYSYGICSELYSDGRYSSRYPHRKFFETKEEVDEWIEEMNEKYGETGWRLGDENIHQSEMPQLWKEWRAKNQTRNNKAL